jgi:hypothetical protein
MRRFAWLLVAIFALQHETGPMFPWDQRAVPAHPTGLIAQMVQGARERKTGQRDDPFPTADGGEALAWVSPMTITPPRAPSRRARLPFLDAARIPPPANR